MRPVLRRIWTSLNSYLYFPSFILLKFGKKKLCVILGLSSIEMYFNFIVLCFHFTIGTNLTQLLFD